MASPSARIASAEARGTTSKPPTCAGAWTLFDDHVAYRADLGMGIERGRLVPFTYFGLRDDVDYAQIPWRNRRFDPAALAAAVQTQRRMERLWRAWGEHPGTRTLIFCCSIDHARFARRWLADRGVRVEAVHAASDSADRGDALSRLGRGELDAICVVDMFNEGVDLPSVDRVVMVRPTESPVIFLQQLGRGLRMQPGKASLVVIDFVGNHRLFLERLRRLLSLGGKAVGLQALLDGGALSELPPGCSVELEVEAKELLRQLLPRGGSEVERVYREIKAARGTRPTAGELFRMGYRPETLRRSHGSWLPFVAAEGDLNEDESRALATLGEWFREVETTEVTKSFKMVTLTALIESEALATGLPIDALAQRCRAILQRSPDLLRDLEEAGEPTDWLAYWKKNPIKAWTGTGQFAVEQDRLVPRFVVPSGLETTVSDLTRELVDYRLARYRERTRTNEATSESSFTCRVTWNQRDPILKLPSRDGASLPTGETVVRLVDGSVWTFRLMKEFCNAARPVGTANNRLPDLLRRWFGPNAGHPGTAFSVRFSRSPDGWWVEPLGKVLELPARGRVVAFPSPRAAAGQAAGIRGDEPEAGQVSLPLAHAGDDLFAVRAAGDSMAGGKDPIQDGDWLVLRWARAVGLGAVAGRVALVKTPDEHGGFAYQVKRIVKDTTTGRWTLRSDNPDRPSLDATADSVPIALLVEHVSPEVLAPPVGSTVTTKDLAGAFGLDEPVSTHDGRHGGHLFLFVTDRGRFLAPDRLERVVADRRPGETAFVLARHSDGQDWRYCGVGRWLEQEEVWALPALDYATWRALGKGRECSRRLDASLLVRAREVIASFGRLPLGTWLELIPHP